MLKISQNNGTEEIGLATLIPGLTGLWSEPAALVR